MVRRNCTADFPTDKMTKFACITAGFKYGAYIISYPVWALILQFLLLLLVTLGISCAIFIPYKYACMKKDCGSYNFLSEMCKLNLFSSVF